MMTCWIFSGSLAQTSPVGKGTLSSTVAPSTALSSTSYFSRKLNWWMPMKFALSTR